MIGASARARVASPTRVIEAIGRFDRSPEACTTGA